MVFWSSAATTAAHHRERLQHAESKLLEWVGTFGQHDYDIQSIDTPIDTPSCLQKHAKSTTTTTTSSLSHFACCSSPATLAQVELGAEDEDGPVSPTSSIQSRHQKEDDLHMHAIRVQSKHTLDAANSTQTPIVLLHGYMNAAAYFYRNLAGLSHYFSTVYSVDLLGWGLSSRPAMPQDTSIEATEAFFVDSLESWRQRQAISKMVLAGHSLGGYIAVAYCEKYPQHVERLILLSPVGVPDDQSPMYQERQAKLQSNWKSRAMVSVAESMFDRFTIGSLLRKVPLAQGQRLAYNYVQGRLTEIADVDERTAVAQYLYANNVATPSGELALNRLLTPHVLAKRPLQHRIPKLAVSQVAFLYGSTDWMDVSAALMTQRYCQNNSIPTQSSSSSPDCHVYEVRDAGHLLTLQNWHMTNAVLIYASGGTIPKLQHPVILQDSSQENKASPLVTKHLNSTVSATSTNTTTSTSSSWTPEPQAPEQQQSPQRSQQLQPEQPRPVVVMTAEKKS